jgi:tetratricopeptide (TPR) repeat protein
MTAYPDGSTVTRAVEPLTLAPADVEALSRLTAVPPDAYELRGEVARGGMGVIVEAWDRRHERSVAIKMLKEQDPLLVGRFLREVRVTAQLQHPSIIPLYEAGRWTTGEPYYAMRLVEGRSLAQAAKDATTTRERLALMPHLVALAEALAYAHERGYIHRDLKPSNVLVGRFGETVVIDWGIAKKLGDADIMGSGAAPAAGQEELTVAGEVLGTIAFMPPEQARGEPVDARADVYALGALAYHVLTGAVPYGDGTGPSLVRVVSEAPAPVEVVAPELPAELRAIVSKAMSRDPVSRYPSAEELAADLRAFAMGRLVSAMSYSRLALLRRWLLRHRAGVTVGLVFVVTLAAVLAVTGTRIVRERDRSDRNRAAAEKLVSYLLKELRDKLESIGKLDVLSGLGTEIERYYAGVEHDTPDAPTLVRQADALALLARAATKAGDVDAALARAAAARQTYERALRVDPSNVDADLGACAMIVQAGDLIGEAGKGLDASDTYREAAACMDAAVGRHPDHARLLRNDATTQWRVGLAAETKGDYAEARRRYLAGRVPLEQANAHGGHYTADEAWLAQTLATIARRSGDLEEARTEGERAIEARRRVRQSDPEWSEATETLVDTLDAHAQTETTLGDWGSARAHLEEAVSLADGLLQREPKNVRWRVIAADALNDLCQLHVAREDLEPARTVCDRALEEGRTLAAEPPDRRTHLNAAMLAEWAQGHIVLLGGDIAAARAHAHAAVDLAERQLAVAPHDSFVAQSRQMAYSLAGDVELAAGDGAAAVKAYTAALAAAEQLAKMTSSPWNAQEVASSLVDLGDAELKAGDAAAAHEHHARAHAMAQEQAPHFRAAVSVVYLLARTTLRAGDRAAARTELESIPEDRLEGAARRLLAKLRAP